MPTALNQGRISTDHTERLRDLLGANWTVLEWDPRKHDTEAFPPDMTHQIYGDQ